MIQVTTLEPWIDLGFFIEYVSSLLWKHIFCLLALLVLSGLNFSYVCFTVITRKYEEKAASINYSLATNISKKITMTLTWNATTWKNSMYGKNLKYFKVELRHQVKQFSKYVNAASNVSNQT